MTYMHPINSADARRRQIRLMQLVFAGAATFATLALFNAGPANADTAVASAPTVAVSGPQAAPSVGNGASIIAVDNDDTTDNGQSGAIFQQNAEDQSTADGAGT